MIRILGVFLILSCLAALPALCGAQSVHPMDLEASAPIVNSASDPILNTTSTPISNSTETVSIESTTPEIRKIDLKDYPLTIEVAGQVLPVTGIDAKQALQLLQWEKENNDAWWRFWLAYAGVFGAIFALFFTAWRTTVFHLQIKEERLANYRERLFSEDPGAVIAAAMSLSSYPREAVWLVMRWAQEHKKEQPEVQGDKTIVFHNRDDRYQIKQAIQDALDNMANQTRWYFEGFQWPPFKKIQGARLDGKTISIDIGPIRLRNAYMVGGNFSSIGLKKSNFIKANLERAIFSIAHLEGTDFGGAKLKEAHFGFAHLEEATFQNAHLEKAIFGSTNLQGTNLMFAHLAGADFENAHMEGINYIDNDFLSYASSQSACLDEKQQERVNLWNTDHPDAPWLQKGWKFWWQPNAKQTCEEETRIVREYIERIREEEKSEKGEEENKI